MKEIKILSKGNNPENKDMFSNDKKKSPGKWKTKASWVRKRYYEMERNKITDVF